VDVTQEADVVEEILRIYGLNNIELVDFARADFLAAFPERDINGFQDQIGGLLAGNGYYEIWTNSLTNPSYQKKFGLTFPAEAVEILNKLSEEQGILRQTMLFTGLEVCAHNINRKQKDLKFYEFGKVYYRKDGRYHENERLALYMTGNTESETWQRKVRPAGYYDLAQCIHNIVEKTGIKDVKAEGHRDQLFDYAARFSTGKRAIGIGGKVKTALLKDFGIK